MTAESYAPIVNPITRRLMVRYVLGMALFFALCAFVPAGSWTWDKGWLFIVVYQIVTALSAWYLWRANPEIYIARAKYHPGSKRWDLFIVPALLAAMAAIFVVAALDDGRYHWHPISWRIVALGYLLWIVAFALMTWAEAHNKFFEPTVRIQLDRGHHVIDTGPYAYVRHPGYVAALLLFVGLPLSLASLYALIPAAIACLIMILRTAWEDSMLKNELPGYKEYAGRVRYRLLPGVW